MPSSSLWPGCQAQPCSSTSHTLVLVRNACALHTLLADMCLVLHADWVSRSNAYGAQQMFIDVH